MKFALLLLIMLMYIGGLNAWFGRSSSSSRSSVRSSWSRPSVRRSWSRPSVRRSWSRPSVRRSWSRPSVRRSWSRPSVRRSWSRPSVRRSWSIFRRTFSRSSVRRSRSRTSWIRKKWNRIKSKGKQTWNKIKSTWRKSKSKISSWIPNTWYTKSGYPHDIKTKSGLTKLYNSKVVKVEKYKRPFLGLKSIPHEGVVATLADGRRYLIHKGLGYGKSSSTVVVDAKHMSNKWEKISSKSTSGKTIGDLVKAGLADKLYKPGSLCYDSADGIMKAAGKRKRAC